MSVPVVSQVVTFAGAAVRLAGPWSMTPGLEPDVHTAAATAAEFARLGPNPVGLVGDVVIGGAVTVRQIELVAATPKRVGATADDPARHVVEWELTLADFRAAYVEPRGGRVFGGVVNPSPRLPTDPAYRNNSDLLNDLAGAMSGLGVAVPGQADDAPPMTDLEWHGAHAPSEMGRVLSHCGLVYCPGLNGVGGVYAPNVGGPIDLSGVTVASRMPAGGRARRPTRCAVISSPSAVTLTFDHQAANAPSWAFVVEQPDGRFVPIAEDPDLAADPRDDVRDGFQEIPEARRELVSQQLYRVVRLDPAAFPPRRSPILREVYLADGSVGEVHLHATLARQVGPGDAPRFRNVAGRLYATQIDQERGLVWFDRRLGTVETDDVGDLDADFVPLPPSQLKMTFSVESHDRQTGERELYGRLFTLSDAGTASGSGTPWAALKSRDAGLACVCEPSLRLVRFNGLDANLAAVDAEAAKVAASMARPAGQPEVIDLVGFVPATCNGRVSAVAWDVDAVKTIIEIDGHLDARGGGSRIAAAAGPFYAARGSRGGGLTSAPTAATGATLATAPASRPGGTQAAAASRAEPRRQASGGAGRSQPAVSVRPRPSSLPGTGVAVCQITAAVRDGENWRWTYSGRGRTWTGGWALGGGSSRVLTLLNTVESGNGASGMVSGIALDSKVVGILPIPTGTRVVAVRRRHGGEERWLFSLPNAPVVEC